MSAHETAQNGWTAVPIDAGKLFNGKPFRTTPEPVLVSQVQFPSHDPIVAQIQQYAKEKLPIQTYNHSMRIFYFSTIIFQQQFPEHAAKLSPSTLALTALLHDIGTAEEHLSATHMSFDFYGAIVALDLLKKLGASKDQAEATCEAIIRHQDLGTEGTITVLGQVIQLATIYDNVTEHPSMPDIKDIIHTETLEDVVRAFPRGGWSGCFASTIRKEIGLKGWCHSTHINRFDQIVENNQFMSRLD